MPAENYIAFLSSPCIDVPFIYAPVFYALFPDKANPDMIYSESVKG